MGTVAFAEEIDATEQEPEEEDLGEDEELDDEEQFKPAEMPQP